jgi:hypothetical protein
VIDQILSELQRLVSAKGYHPTHDELRNAHPMVLEEYYKALVRTRTGKPLPSFNHLREHIDPRSEANRQLARVAGRGIYSRQKA